MPWMIVEEDGRYCVHKKNDDGSAGDTVACHDSEDMAKRQMAALYANEPAARSQPDPDTLPEYRSLPFVDFESRDDGWAFEGLAAPYDSVADLGEFTEEFKRGAYRKALASGANTQLRYDHSPPHFPILASIAGGTMQIKDDVKGVVVRASIAKHYLGEAARELVKRGDIKGMSPGFVVGRGNGEVVMRGAKPHRIIHNLKSLIEISLTPDPAYAATTAELRSRLAMQMAESLDEWQRALLGALPAQLESRAIEDPPAETPPEPVTEPEAEPEGSPQEPPEETPVEEQPPGADADVAYAARARRLQMLGLTLPR